MGRRYNNLFWLSLPPLLISFQHGASAQVVSNNVKTGYAIWMPAVAALVGGLVSGILGPLLKDLVIQRFNERHSDHKLREQIEESYLAPLSASAEKLIWRMSEILIDRRTHFLMLKTHPIDFSQYKRLSTLYRIASLLGWIRAMNLELSALPRGGFGASSPMFKALRQVQSAMADGHGVEAQRFRSFCTACAIDVSLLANDQFESLAAGFEVALYALTGDDLRKDHRYLVGSTVLHQEFICRGSLQFIVERKLSASIDDQALRSVLTNLVECLGYREALIYREWQDAIGDSVIVKDDHSSARSYRIVGFEEFEKLVLTGTSNWIAPLREFIEDVDLESPDASDQRPRQLRDFAKGVAGVLIAISTSSQGALVNSDALKQARALTKIR